MAVGELFQRSQYGDQSAEQKPESIAHHNEIGVVGDERARSPEVEIWPGSRGLIAEGVDMGHDIVAEAAFIAGGRHQVGIVEMRSHLTQRLFGDVDPQLSLRLSQGEP
jgi:hypothetical protein